MKHYLILLLCSISYLQALSCSCEGPERFVDGITKEHFIFLGEIIDEEILEFPYGKDTIFYRITVLEVLKKYSGGTELKSDTLRLINSTGFECFSGLPRNSINKKFILKGKFEEMYSYSLNWEEEPISYGSFFQLWSCDEPVISVDKNKATGLITIKRLEAYEQVRKRRYEFADLELKSSKRAKRYYEKYLTNSNGNFYQKMSFRKAQRIVRSHIRQSLKN